MQNTTNLNVAAYKLPTDGTSKALAVWQIKAKKLTRKFKNLLEFLKKGVDNREKVWYTLPCW